MDIIISTILTLISFSLLLVSTLVFFVLLKIYTGKSINDPSRPPVYGTVFHQLLHFNRLYDYQADVAIKHPTFRLLAPDQSELYTADVRNVEHILKIRFDNYVKGQYNLDIFRDLFGYGIFAVNGDKWRHQRKLSSFEFSTRVLRDFSCGVFRKSGVKLVRIISGFCERNQAFDVHDLLMRCTLDSIFKIGFGVELNCLNGSSKEGVEFMKAFDEANALVYWRFVDPSWKLKRALNIGSEAALRRHTKVMNEFLRAVIKNKRKTLEHEPESLVKDDILSRFLEASKQDPDEMNDEYLRDIILNFTIAGKDSTANTLSWLIYSLCKNPVIQEKLFVEVREIVDCSAKIRSVDEFLELLTDEVLEKMPYLHAVLTETARLYPGVPIDGRSAVEDDILPDGHKVNKGDDVYYMSYAMARMPYIWGVDAEVFRPERWLEKGVFKPESPFKFIAFHAGPRICLGKDFAYRQMKIISVALVQYFRFKLADETRRVTYRMMFTLHIKGGLHIQVLPRTPVF